MQTNKAIPISETFSFEVLNNKNPFISSLTGNTGRRDTMEMVASGLAFLKAATNAEPELFGKTESWGLFNILGCMEAALRHQSDKEEEEQS